MPTIAHYGPDERIALGGHTWTPQGAGQGRLRDSLRESLSADGIVDLVVFGSLARGATTGFSDVDAILVIEDEYALDKQSVARLRHSVLGAGRAVLSFQPLQHHGFIVVTPRLLDYPAALGLPPEALGTTVSLFGCSIDAVVGRPDSVDAFRKHASALKSVTEWPRHAWALHRVVAEFELAPALYVQACGRSCPKHASFEIARADFGAAWAPYEILDQVRLTWPYRREWGLQCLARALRNPWAATAVRRRVPARAPDPASILLDKSCLAALQLSTLR